MSAFVMEGLWEYFILITYPLPSPCQRHKGFFLGLQNENLVVGARGGRVGPGGKARKTVKGPLSLKFLAFFTPMLGQTQLPAVLRNYHYSVPPSMWLQQLLLEV